ncbi:SDR family NAD(P)-dependent oxidoreductase [Streptosporangium sandarakinum]|uniref:SDR family NAD(P)-dependent oxidoreductase n=1 Tax=Streptosporangium sandarakinum TaxID=1260955 RepID=UPI00372047B7
MGEESRPWSLEDLAPASLFDVTGKVALVTGAGGGVGGWLAAGLAAAGARVVVSDISEERCSALVSFLEDNKVDFTVAAADLRESRAPKNLVGTARKEFGGLDVLVNAAAINVRKPIANVTPELWTDISDVNLKAAYFLAREAMPVMRAGGGGSIINVTSINTEIGLEGVSVYGANKAALAQVTKTMCIEWAQYNIRANCISPGFLMTSLSRPLWEDADRAAWILERCPLRRPGMPAELVGACLLLASDAGSFISGTSIRVDGGLIAGSPWKPPAR